MTARFQEGSSQFCKAVFDVKVFTETGIDIDIDLGVDRDIHIDIDVDVGIDVDTNIDVDRL